MDCAFFLSAAARFFLLVPVHETVDGPDSPAFHAQGNCLAHSFSCTGAMLASSKDAAHIAPCLPEGNSHPLPDRPAPSQMSALGQRSNRAWAWRKRLLRPVHPTVANEPAGKLLDCLCGLDWGTDAGRHHDRRFKNHCLVKFLRSFPIGCPLSLKEFSRKSRVVPIHAGSADILKRGHW